jgi:hypothetical protein
MTDENTAALMGQLKELQKTANTACYALVVIAVLVFAITWRIWH